MLPDGRGAADAADALAISTKGWRNFGLVHLPPERKRKRERVREDDGGSKRTRVE